MDNIMISFGKCCNPVPGDPITGIVTRGRGIVVHTNSLQNLLRLMQEPERIIDVALDVDKENRFLAGLYILASAAAAFLADLSEAVSSSDGIITSANMNAISPWLTAPSVLKYMILIILTGLLLKSKRWPE